MTPELFLERGGELRIVREDFSVYVRYCYVHLSKFSFFSSFPCPFFLIFFSKQIAIPTSIYYFELLAKIGVDTAENEPLEAWRKIQFTIHFTP